MVTYIMQASYDSCKLNLIAIISLLNIAKDYLLGSYGMDFEPIPVPVDHIPNAGSCMHDRLNLAYKMVRFLLCSNVDTTPDQNLETGMIRI